MSAGAFKGKRLGDLSRANLEKVAAKGAGTGEEKALAMAFARAALAIDVLELHAGTASSPGTCPGRAPLGEPAPCTVLSLVADRGRTVHQAAKEEAQQTQSLPPARAFPQHGLRVIGLLALCLVLYPPLAAVPAYLLGHVVWLVATRLRRAAEIFCSTFDTVLGQLASDLGSYIWSQFTLTPAAHADANYPLGQLAVTALALSWAAKLFK